MCVSLVDLASTHVASNRRSDGEVIILATVVPDTIIVPVRRARLEELVDLGLTGGRAALVVLAYPVVAQARVRTLDARIVEVDVAPNERRVGHGAGDRERVPVHEADVAIRRPRGGEVAFQLRIARDVVRFGADEHGTARAVARRHTDRRPARAEGAATTPGAGVFPVDLAADPVADRGRERDAFLAAVGWLGRDAWVCRVDHGGAFGRVRCMFAGDFRVGFFCSLHVFVRENHGIGEH